MHSGGTALVAALAPLPRQRRAMPARSSSLAPLAAMPPLSFGRSLGLASLERSTLRRPRIAVRAATVAVASPVPEAEPAVVPSGRRVAIFVEPSPFSHTSGMKNRFLNLIINLRDSGDEVLVFTPDANPPKEYHGAEVVGVFGFPMPLYDSKTLRLSTGLSMNVWRKLKEWKPQVLHAAVPGIMVFSTILYSQLLHIPLVTSYHTHVPEYIKKYTWGGFEPLMWFWIRVWSRASNLMLVTSAVMKKELAENKCAQLDVWMRGVDTEIFNPKFRSEAMRERMTHPSLPPGGPLLVHIGRLGLEKNLKSLRGLLEATPGATLAFVGDGPQRGDLEEHFKGTPTVFLGMLSGEALSQAFASGDAFVMPSETETLGFVVLEAMASGTPVVAVAAGGITDIITDPGRTGLLYPPGDYAACAAHVKSLLADPALAARIAAGARADVEKWGWGPATRHLREKQYTRAIRRFRAARRFSRLLNRISAERAAEGTVRTVMRGHYVAHATSALAACALLAAVQWGAGPSVHHRALAEGAAAAAAAATMGPGASLSLLCAAIAVMGAVPLVPMPPLAMAVGYAIGAKWGGLLAWLSITLAALAAYWSARFTGSHLLPGTIPLGVARPFLQNQLSCVEAAVAAGSLGRCAWECMLVRLRPLAPFSLSNFLLVGTGLRGTSYLVGTAAGMAPWAALYATTGAALRAAIEARLSPQEVGQRLAARIGRLAAAGQAGELLTVEVLVGTAFCMLLASLYSTRVWRNRAAARMGRGLGR